MSNLQPGAPLSEQDQLAADIAAAQPQNKIAEFKQLYPAYKDVPDLELADALHEKFYSDIPRDAYLTEVGLSDAGGAMSTSMDREAYQKRFLADNPQAGQDALDAVMAQYDKQAADRAKAPELAKAAADAKAAALAKLPADKQAEALAAQQFNDRLDARLKGKQNGVVPQLPGYTQDTTDYSYHDPTLFDKTAGNFMGGMLGTLLGAGSAGGKLFGADMSDWDAAREQIAAEQKKRLGGDTFTGKVSSLVGGVVPAMAAPEGAIEQAISNAGLFAIPAFQDKLKEKLDAGESRAAAMVHAAEAFGINMVAPTVMQKGFGAVLGKAAEGAPGLGQAALQLGQAAGEGVGFSALNSGLDKATDTAFGYKNDRPWLDPEDMAVQAVGFGGMRAAHMGVQLGAEALARSDAQHQQELLDAIGKAGSVDEAIAAASAAVSPPASGFVADQLQRLRPLESGPMTWNEATGQAMPDQVQIGEKYVRTTNPDGTTGFSLAPADPLPPEGGTPAQLGTEYMRVTKADGSTGFVPVESLPGDTGGTPSRIGAEYGRIQNPDGSTGMALASANDATVWRRANDPTIPTLTDRVDHLRTDIPTLTDQLAGPDGIPTLTDEVPGQTPIPTLTDEITRPTGDGWNTFPKESGTLGIPRAEMPQIRAEHRGALVNFLKARGIPHEQVELPADSLKPTQAEFSLDKVNQAHDYQDGDRSILTSSDGHVLDGHHQWLASLEKDAPVKAIRLDAPIRKLLDTVKAFPSVEKSGGEPRAWHASEFAPRIEKMLGDLRAKGLDDHAKVLEGGIESDLKHGQLTEAKIAFREQNARQAIANDARNNGTAPAAPVEKMTADRMHEVADTAAALPRQILEAAAKKWNPIAEQLGKMGFQYGEVHSNAPIEAQRLHRNLKDIVQSLLGLAPRRYMAEKGYKNADPKKLKQAEEFASQVLGIKTKRYPGIDTSSPITLGRGIIDAEERSQAGRQQAMRMRERLKESNPFLHLIADHGVSVKDRSDLGIEKSQNPPVPGFGPVIRKNGKRLDELALHARDAGFLTNHDIESALDTGGTRKLSDMIRRALGSKEVIKTPSMVEAALPSRDEQLHEEAARLGIDATGKTADELYDQVAAAHRAEDEHQQQTGADSASEQHLIEEYADYFPAEELADARLNDDDIPFDLNDPRMSTTNHFAEETHDETTGLQDAGGAREDRGQAAADPAGAAREGAGRTENQGQSAEGDLLSSYSRGDVLERQGTEEAAAKARQAERDRLEQLRRREQDDKDVRARMDASAEHFQLGQDAHDSLAGQGDIFSQPAPVDERTPIQKEMARILETKNPLQDEDMAILDNDGQRQAPPEPHQLPDLEGMFDTILAEEMAAKPEMDLSDMFDAILAEEHMARIGDKLQAREPITIGDLNQRQLEKARDAARTRLRKELWDVETHIRNNEPSKDEWIRENIQLKRKPDLVEHHTELLAKKAELEKQLASSTPDLTQSEILTAAGKPRKMRWEDLPFHEGRSMKFEDIDKRYVKVSELLADPHLDPQERSALEAEQAAMDAMHDRLGGSMRHSETYGHLYDKRQQDMRDKGAERAKEKAAAEEKRRAREAKRAQNPPLAEGIPLSFLKRINVDHSTYDHDAGRWETKNMPADKALRSVRDDISNLEAMLKCMKG